MLGEEFLIIQKEFDGFSDTKERLDLLALDKQGNLVLIENKLDDSGRDVAWQALKYVSYCSTLTKDNIEQIYQEYLNKYEPKNNKTAKELIVEFLGGNEDLEELVINKGYDQRIILVAASFRKEVTSTVLWLMNYGIKLQCFKVTPHKLDQQLFLNVEQIIPIKDAEDYIIKMAKKQQTNLYDEDNGVLKESFWRKLLPKMNEKTDIFTNVTPKKSSRISATAGKSGVYYQLAIAKSYCRIELYIDTGDKSANKQIFDSLYKSKDKIESEFGDDLSWERLENNRASKIVCKIDKNGFDKEDWDEVSDIMIDKMIRFSNSLKKALNKI
ncbi:MAG: DUF4268 domain-containing protein [Firmicutes bacterium]|nr:DUF4268 domain-containing protein [Bacillota bacterium]